MKVLKIPKSCLKKKNTVDPPAEERIGLWSGGPRVACCPPGRIREEQKGAATSPTQRAPPSLSKFARCLILVSRNFERTRLVLVPGPRWLSWPGPQEVSFQESQSSRRPLAITTDSEPRKSKLKHQKHFLDPKQRKRR